MMNEVFEIRFVIGKNPAALDASRLLLLFTRGILCCFSIVSDMTIDHGYTTNGNGFLVLILIYNIIYQRFIWIDWIALNNIKI